MPIDNVCLTGYILLAVKIQTLAVKTYCVHALITWTNSICPDRGGQLPVKVRSEKFALVKEKNC